MEVDRAGLADHLCLKECCEPQILLRSVWGSAGKESPQARTLQSEELGRRQSGCGVGTACPLVGSRLKWFLQPAAKCLDVPKVPKVSSSVVQARATWPASLRGYTNAHQLSIMSQSKVSSLSFRCCYTKHNFNFFSLPSASSVQAKYTSLSSLFFCSLPMKPRLQVFLTQLVPLSRRP